MLLWDLIEKKAKWLYGDPLPDPIRERLLMERAQIERFGQEAKWIGIWKLMALCKCIDDMVVQVNEAFCYYLSAFLLGITQVNPLQTHCICPQCHDLRFMDRVPTQGELWHKTCTCGVDMLSLGYNLPFDMVENNPWKPGFRVSQSHLQLVQAWNEDLPPRERVLVEENYRLERLHRMLRDSEICFWDIPAYDFERLDLFSRPFPDYYEESSCLGIDEIAASHSMLKLLTFVGCGSMQELIKLSSCALQPPRFAEQVLHAVQTGTAFENIITCAEDCISGGANRQDDRVFRSFCEVFPTKAKAIQNALLALQFSYVKLAVDPAVFYVELADHMLPESWGSCYGNGEMDMCEADAWERANAMLQIEEPVPESVTFEELAAYFDLCGKKIGDPFFGKNLLLLTEISTSSYAAETWERIDPLWF